jgi:hypothetical protein
MKKNLKKYMNHNEKELKEKELKEKEIIEKELKEKGLKKDLRKNLNKGGFIREPWFP